MPKNVSTINRPGTTSSMKTATPNAMKRSAIRAACGICSGSTFPATRSEVVENICGTPKADFLKVCDVLASTSAADRTTTFLYALGWTQHTVGAQNIRTMAMIQLLLGNMGMAGGGVNALRGHSNIQGADRFGPVVDQSAGLFDAAIR